MTEPKTDAALQEQTAGALAPKNIADAVLQKVTAKQQAGELVIPDDYNVGNALNEAWLTLQEVKDKSGKPALEKCTKASVSMALLDMAVQGLSPARSQCYFVVYGDQLTLMRSYMGTVLTAKRFGGVKDVFAQVVFEGDAFEYEIDPATGIKSVTKHQQKLESTDGQILAAYATVIRDDDTRYQEIMTWKEIQAAWNQGATNGKSPAHQKFPQEMAKKTVINRACKVFINSATGQPALAESYNRTTANDYLPDEDHAVIVDVEEVETKKAADAAIFGEPETAEQTEAETPTPIDEMTDEEKAEMKSRGGAN